jgi:hypothetical protein
MVGRVDTGTALGSGAVDAQFWALVCEDEEWLDAEFAGIVSGPAESRIRVRRRPGLSVGREWPGRSPCPVDAGPVGCRPGIPVGVRGGGWRRQRSPPRRGMYRVRSVVRGG